MAIVYEIANLTKTYKNSAYKANDRLTLDIHEGEIFGLLGPNGAGKSTLVNQVAGLIQPTTGSIQLFGIDVVKRPSLIPHYVALQPQYSTALQDLYPEEAIAYTGKCRGLPPREACQQTDALMAELRLDHLRKRRIRLLSGGQRKLITLALTFVGNRPVQIFDEPTNELDPELRRLIWDKLLHLNQQGTTIILVTHNVLEAERVIQRVGIINGGRLVALGSPGEMKRRIDQRIRLELFFRADVDYRGAWPNRLGEVHVLSCQRWVVLCQRAQVHEAISQVISQIGLELLEDFRILTPSLEDVYLQLREGEAARE